MLLRLLRMKHLYEEVEILAIAIADLKFDLLLFLHKSVDVFSRFCPQNARHKQTEGTLEILSIVIDHMITYAFFINC